MRSSKMFYLLVALVLLVGLLPTTAAALTAAPTLDAWTQLALGTGCPDWTRLDAGYSAGTGKAYIMGGRSGTATDGTIYALDPATNTCTSTGLTMPVPISNYIIAPVNNGTADLLCTFGGRDSAGAYSTAVQCFDPVANTVATVSTLPGNLGLYIPGGAAAVGGKAYVFSGFRNTTTPYHIVETWEWDPVANTWTQKGDQSIGRGYEEVGVVDGKIYAFGGDVYDGTNLVAQTVAEVFDPATGNWSLIAPLATASGEGRGFGFDTASGYALAGKIVLAGGGQWPADTNAALTYDVATNTYDDAFPDLNITRRDQGHFFVPGDPGTMWVYGGRSSATGYGGDNPPYAPPETYAVQVQHTLHLHQMKLKAAPAGAGYKLSASGVVHDQAHAPAPGVVVYGTWTLPGGGTLDKQATTNASGQFKFTIKSSLTGTFNFCVTNMTKDGYTYVPGDNEVKSCKKVVVP